MKILLLIYLLIGFILSVVLGKVYWEYYKSKNYKYRQTLLVYIVTTLVVFIMYVVYIAATLIFWPILVIYVIIELIKDFKKYYDSRD